MEARPDDLESDAAVTDMSCAARPALEDQRVKADNPVHLAGECWQLLRAHRPNHSGLLTRTAASVASASSASARGI